MPWFLQTCYVDSLKEASAAKNTTWEDDMLSPGRKEQLASEASVDERIRIVEKTFAEAAELGASGSEGLQQAEEGVHAVEVTGSCRTWSAEVDLVHTSFDDAPPNQLSENGQGRGAHQGGHALIQGCPPRQVWIAYLVPTTKRKAEEAGAGRRRRRSRGGRAGALSAAALHNHEIVTDSDEAKKTHLVYRPGDGPLPLQKFASHFRLRKRLRTDEGRHGCRP